MNSLLISVAIVSLGVLMITIYAHEANATCVIGPSGSTLCAGMSQTINIPKSNHAENVVHNGIPNVIIIPSCAINDIRYGDYFNTCYQPTTLYVTPGTIVTWQNNDTFQHTVTYGNPWSELAQGYFFGSEILGPGDSYSHVFKYPGAYPYYDAFNFWETGLIVVKK